MNAASYAARKRASKRLGIATPQNLRDGESKLN
jgi:hypothetical protein